MTCTALLPGLSQERPAEALPLPATCPRPWPHLPRLPPPLPPSETQTTDVLPLMCIYASSILCNGQGYPEVPPSQETGGGGTKHLLFGALHDTLVAGLRPVCTQAPTGILRHLCSWYNSTFPWNSLAFSFLNPHSLPHHFHTHTEKHPSLHHSPNENRKERVTEWTQSCASSHLSYPRLLAGPQSTLARPENITRGPGKKLGTVSLRDCHPATAQHISRQLLWEAPLDQSPSSPRTRCNAAVIGAQLHGSGPGPGTQRLARSPGKILLFTAEGPLRHKEYITGFAKYYNSNVWPHRCTPILSFNGSRISQGREKA